jgi:hypothetical protein
MVFDPAEVLLLDPTSGRSLWFRSISHAQRYFHKHGRAHALITVLHRMPTTRPPLSWNWR